MVTPLTKNTTDYQNYLLSKEQKMQDTFRKETRELSEKETGAMLDVKSQAEVIETSISDNTDGSNGREMALAKTKLEECVMWFVKGLTK